MAPNSDTRENIITWFTKEFGFSRNAATALRHVQALKDAQALSELDDNDAVANVCKAVGKDVGQSVAKIAMTKLKLACFRIRHQYRTSREIRGPKDHLLRMHTVVRLIACDSRSKKRTSGLPLVRSPSTPR
jgi:hypothetical protein